MIGIKKLKEENKTLKTEREVLGLLVIQDINTVAGKLELSFNSQKKEEIKTFFQKALNINIKNIEKNKYGN